MGIIKNFKGGFLDAWHDTDEHKIEFDREQAKIRAHQDQLRAKMQANREERLAWRVERRQRKTQAG